MFDVSICALDKMRLKNRQYDDFVLLKNDKRQICSLRSGLIGLRAKGQAKKCSKRVLFPFAKARICVIMILQKTVRMHMQEKCSCVKEPIGTIPIMRIVEKVDEMCDKDDLQGAKRVLEYWEKEARALRDTKGLLEVLSEQIGLYRKLGEKEKGLRAVDEALSILACDGTCSSVGDATIYLNCATTMKAFGKAQEAIEYYELARGIYEKALEKDDYRLAGLFNNYATALCDLHRFSEGRECYEKAIDILKAKGGFCELAVSYVNLANLVFDEAQTKGETADDEVEKLLNLAYECLDDKSLERDGNYAFVCSKCAPAFGFFGYFMQKSELESRAKQIYENNRK